MKKLILLVILLKFTLINSQNNNIELGVKAGINYSNSISNTEANPDINHAPYIPADYKSNFGLFAGLYLEKKINKVLSFQSELLISQQNVKFTIDYEDLALIYYFNNDNTVYKQTMGEIKEYNLLIPLSINLYLNKKFNFEFGPQVGFNLSRAISFKNHPSDTSQIIADDNSDKFELAINIGIGYKILEKYKIAFRYSYGIINRNYLKNSIFQLGLSYKL